MDQQPTWIGRTLSGRYRIGAMLRQGGMLAVYKATDPNLKRVVAIKLIHPHLSSDPSFAQRFEGEAAAVASLRHPNIVQVYNFNNDNGVYSLPTETSAATEQVAPVTVATDTLAPTEAATEAPTATETMPPLYVRIDSIIVDATGHYVVNYETFGYTEQLPGMHVHFFFNTVTVEQAGSPGSGPWYLYGGPHPFTKYSETDRPANATEMCALVANRNHSIIPGSGNCVNLP